jgi:hypothetical protein
MHDSSKSLGEVNLAQNAAKELKVCKKLASIKIILIIINIHHKDHVFAYRYTQIPAVPNQFIPPPKGNLQLLHDTKHDAFIMKSVNKCEVF